VLVTQVRKINFAVSVYLVKMCQILCKLSR